MKEPYKSLSQHYAELNKKPNKVPLAESYTKQYMPPRAVTTKKPRTLTEAWEVVVTDKGTNPPTPVGTFQVDTKEDVNDILGHMHVTRSELTESLRSWLNAAGWNTPKVTKLVFNAIADSIKLLLQNNEPEVVNNAITKLTENKENLGYEVSLSKYAGQRTTLASLFSKEASIFVNNPDVFREFLLASVNMKPAVGRGEIAITLLSEGVKGSDVRLGSGKQVEVKLESGRLGDAAMGDRHNKAVASFANQLEEMHKNERAALQTRIDAGVEEIKKFWKAAPELNKSRAYERVIGETPVKTDDLITLRGAVIRWADVAVNGKEGQAMLEIIETLSSNLARVKEIDRQHHGSTLQLVAIANYFIRHKEGEGMSDIVWEFLARHFKTPGEIPENAKSQLMKAYQSAETESDINKIIGAIQMVDYSQQEKFTYLQVINHNLDQLTILFTGDTSKDIETCLSLARNFSLKPSSPGVPRGFTITLK